MTDFNDLQQFFKDRDITFIMAADAEPVVAKKVKGEFTHSIPAGGVAVALEPITRAAHGIYIGRGKTDDDKEEGNMSDEVTITRENSSFLLRRIFLTPEEEDNYYFGFSNQTLWPMMHVAFQRPEFHLSWYEGYKQVNKKFADAISQYITQSSLVWINDYQLALVPSMLTRPKGSIVGLFWHIPWPTWEIFRILPQKKEILESMLSCDFIAFHRGYQAQNFIETVEREFEARVDRETNRIFYNNHVTTIRNLPMGIDADVIVNTLKPEEPDTFITAIVRSFLGITPPTEEEKKPAPKGKQKTEIEKFFEENKVILGVDRLDYTKGLRTRLKSIDMFFQTHPEHIGNVSYIGILAPSREKIPAYQTLKKEVYALAKEVNSKYGTDNWQPVRLVSGVFTRDEILNLYRKADVCLVTPLDDGMNLVSKEFIAASSLSENPGMLVLSQFAGSAIDLTESIIVNPYSVKEVSDGINTALNMSKQEKKDRISRMAAILQERNVYSWALQFMKDALEAGMARK